jgi:hypothetical protein
VSLTAIGAKLVAGKSAIASAWAAGFLAFVISEVTTQNLWIAVSISAICSVGVALVRTRPQMLSAQTAAHAAAINEWAKLLQQTNELHAEQLKRQRDRTDLERKIQALMRNSKHNIAGEYQSATFYIQDLQEMLRAQNIPVPPFTLRNIKQLTADEDRVTLALLGVSPENNL